jgi:hypothetical protein
MMAAPPAAGVFDTTPLKNPVKATLLKSPLKSAFRNGEVCLNRRRSFMVLHHTSTMPALFFIRALAQTYIFTFSCCSLRPFARNYATPHAHTHTHTQTHISPQVSSSAKKSRVQSATKRLLINPECEVVTFDKSKPVAAHGIQWKMKAEVENVTPPPVSVLPAHPAHVTSSRKIDCLIIIVFQTFHSLPLSLPHLRCTSEKLSDEELVQQLEQEGFQSFDRLVEDNGAEGEGNYLR